MNSLKLKLLETTNDIYWRDIYKIDHEFFIFVNDIYMYVNFLFFSREY